MKSKKICLKIILLMLVIGLYYLFNFYINKNIKENELNISKEVLAEKVARELIQEKWDLASELYNLSDKYFDWGEGKSELEFKESEDGYTFSCYQITNYHEILE